MQNNFKKSPWLLIVIGVTFYAISFGVLGNSGSISITLNALGFVLILVGIIWFFKKKGSGE